MRRRAANVSFARLAFYLYRSVAYAKFLFKHFAHFVGNVCALEYYRADQHPDYRVYDV